MARFFFYSIYKTTRIFDYQTWPTHLFEKFKRYAKVRGLFFFFFLSVLIGWQWPLCARDWNESRLIILKR